MSTAARRRPADDLPLPKLPPGDIINVVGDTAYVSEAHLPFLSAADQALVWAERGRIQEQLDAIARARDAAAAAARERAAAALATRATEKPALTRMCETLDAILALLDARLPPIAPVAESQQAEREAEHVDAA